MHFLLLELSKNVRPGGAVCLGITFTRLSNETKLYLERQKGLARRLPLPLNRGFREQSSLAFEALFKWIG